MPRILAIIITMNLRKWFITNSSKYVVYRQCLQCIKICKRIQGVIPGPISQTYLSYLVSQLSPIVRFKPKHRLKSVGEIDPWSDLSDFLTFFLNINNKRGF